MSRSPGCARCGGGRHDRPADARVPGVVAACGLYFLWLWGFHREVLETEPGDESVFGH
ncbi:hypothetical protein [Rhodococcus olei]|uniref:hypothetical protein n=1 Tax=Rhodococcus olei TaxID=2161675 RepID=UPI0031E4EB2C